MSPIVASGQKPLLPAVQQELDKGKGRTNLDGLNQFPDRHSGKRPGSPPLLVPTASGLTALLREKPCPGTSSGPRFPTLISTRRLLGNSPGAPARRRHLLCPCAAWVCVVGCRRVSRASAATSEL